MLIAICSGSKTCLKDCPKKKPFIVNLFTDDRGSCYHDQHTEGKFHECDPYTLPTCPHCGQRIGHYPEQAGQFVGCSTIRNYGTPEETFCPGYWENHGGMTPEEALTHFNA